MLVDVYYNLRTQLWSVRDATTTHKVIGHASSLVLDGVTFRVNESGRQRVLATKQKNVHAYVRGTLQGARWVTQMQPLHCQAHLWGTNDAVNNECMRVCTSEGKRITYNPYKWATFVQGVTGMVDQEVTPVHRAHAVFMVNRQVYAYRPTQRQVHIV